jgi:cytochrome b
MRSALLNAAGALFVVAIWAAFVATLIAFFG